MTVDGPGVQSSSSARISRMLTTGHEPMLTHYPGIEQLDAEWLKV